MQLLAAGFALARGFCVLFASCMMMAQHGENNHHQMNHKSEMKHQPHMQHGEMNSDIHQQLKAQLKLKLTPGIQKGEISGSFVDAMMQIMPNMQHSPAGMEAGKINPVMIEAMLRGWQDKYGNLPDIEPISMEQEPSAKHILSQIQN